MDDFDGIPHIYTRLLYLFNGELLRIGKFIEENLRDVKHIKNMFTGYGEMYGLYTHSHGGVVHVTTLQNFNQRQLSRAMSRRAKAIPQDYKLSVIGAWLTVEDNNLSVCELLWNKASTLKESESYFCMVVDKPRNNFEDMSGLAKAFFLAKDEVYKIDTKILNRESPFRLDTEFSDMILSAGTTADYSVDDEDWSKSDHLEYVGTEMKDLSSKKMETDIALANSESLSYYNGSELSELPSETNESDCPDTSVEERTVENTSVVKKPQPVLSKKLERDITPANSKNLFDHNGSELPELPSKTRESETPIEDGAEENSVVEKPQPVLPMKEASLEATTSEEDGEPDMETFVDVKLSDADSSHVSPTDEISCEAANSENDKKNRVDTNAGSLDDEQKQSMGNNSVPERNCTLENENKIKEDQRTQENGEDEDIRKEDNVTKNERLPDEDVCATTDQQNEKNMTMKSKDEVTVEKQQEEDDGSSKNTSTRESTIEKNIVPGEEQFQEIENHAGTKQGATVETELTDENEGGSMTCEHNDSGDEKSQQKEDKNVKSDEVPTSENLLSIKEFSKNHKPSGDVDNEVKISSESTEGEKLRNDGGLKESLVTEDSSEDKQVGTEQNNFTSEVEGQKNSSLPYTD